LGKGLKTSRPKNQIFKKIVRNPKFELSQHSDEINRGNLNNVKREASRRFRNKKEKISERQN
jgi:hypothetical protein